jgi:hypothetical protein
VQCLLCKHVALSSNPRAHGPVLSPTILPVGMGKARHSWGQTHLLASRLQTILCPSASVCEMGSGSGPGRRNEEVRGVYHARKRGTQLCPRSVYTAPPWEALLTVLSPHVASTWMSGAKWPRSLSLPLLFSAGQSHQEIGVERLSMQAVTSKRAGATCKSICAPWHLAQSPQPAGVHDY